MWTASRISSIDIRMTMTFLRLRKMPRMPSVNRMAATARKWPSPMIMVLEALPRPHVLELDRGLTRAPHLLGDILALDVGLVAQRQHDSADHGDEQHQACDLEEVDVAGIEHEAERLGI